MKNIALFLASLACGSLSKQMWQSANKVDGDERARNQVFRAAQKVYPSVKSTQKEAVVNSFAKGVRVGSVAVGGVSLGFAVKVIVNLFR